MFLRSIVLFYFVEEIIFVLFSFECKCIFFKDLYVIKKHNSGTEWNTSGAGVC